MALLALGFLLYTADYYRADPTALEVMASEDAAVRRTDYGWLFDGPGEDAALIFYPGGKVEETAYAPLLLSLAESGMDVCLVKMPFRLAVFDIDAADRVRSAHEYKRWYIGGHSLGGSMAADYAADHELSGVILLAAYPTKDLDEPMLLIYGSEDGVMSLRRASRAEEHGSVTRVVIEGGNHALFGSYGAQRGDGPAAIAPEEQRRETVEAVTAWIGG